MGMFLKLYLKDAFVLHFLLIDGFDSWAGYRTSFPHSVNLFLPLCFSL